MSLFLLRFWPVLLPFLVYMLWMWRQKHRARKAGETPPKFHEGPWFWAVVAAFFIAIILFLWLGLQQEAIRGSYTPAHVEDGKVVQGTIHQQ